MSATSIEWATDTWNPLVGCTKISAGCANCYAASMASRFSGEGHAFEGTAARGNWTGRILLKPDKLNEPLRWKKPRRVFVNSMSDLFHDDVPDEFIDRVFETMARAPRHTFLVLTKRPERMNGYLTRRDVGLRWDVSHEWRTVTNGLAVEKAAKWTREGLPNVWLGVSVEDQKAADERIPWLLKTPAAVRFISAEPLLGPVDVSECLPCRFCKGRGWYLDRMTDNGPTACQNCKREAIEAGTPVLAGQYAVQGPRLDWVIVGGESGPNARSMHPDWARSLRDQCAAAGVPYFFKQWGAWAPTNIEPGGDLGGQMRRGITRIMHAPGNPDGHFRRGDAYMSRVGKRAAGRLLDGIEHNAFPEVTP